MASPPSFAIALRILTAEPRQAHARDALGSTPFQAVPSSERDAWCRFVRARRADLFFRRE